MIEIKIPKATLVLTEEEFERAIRRGKAIKRRRALEKRLENSRNRFQKEVEHGT